MNENITANDGKGLYDNEGLCDSLINDLNNLVKQCMNGQYIVACSVVSQIAQKLINLKSGIKHDTDALKNNIEDMKNLNNELNDELNRMLTAQNELKRMVQKNGTDQTL